MVTMSALESMTMNSKILMPRRMPKRVVKNMSHDDILAMVKNVPVIKSVTIDSQPSLSSPLGRPFEAYAGFSKI